MQPVLFSVCVKTTHFFLLTDTITAQTEENIKNTSNGKNSQKCVGEKVSTL